MNMGKNTLERILYIDQLIGSGRFPRKSDIADHFEVACKTIERDLDYMRDRLGAPIIYDRFKGGYGYSEKGYYLPALHMNQHEALALFISHYLGNAWKGTPLAETAETLWQRFSGTMDEEIVIDTSAFSDAIFLLDRSVPMNTEYWLQLFSCIRARKKVEITYKGPGYDKSIICHLRPYRLIHHRDAWYVLGYDEYREALRNYSISRITEVRELAASFSIPDDFVLADHIDIQFGIYTGGDWVSVELSTGKRIADVILEHIPVRDQKVESQPNGEVRISFKTNQKEELKHFILQWGNHIRVVEPKWLQTDLAAIGEFYCKTYGSEK